MKRVPGFLVIMLNVCMMLRIMLLLNDFVQVYLIP